MVSRYAIYKDFISSDVFSNFFSAYILLFVCFIFQQKHNNFLVLIIV